MRPAPDRASQHRLPSGIRDNLDRGKVGDFLKAHIQPGANLAMVSAYFTLASTSPDLPHPLKNTSHFKMKMVYFGAVEGHVKVSSCQGYH